MKHERKIILPSKEVLSDLRKVILEKHELYSYIVEVTTPDDLKEACLVVSLVVSGELEESKLKELFLTVKDFKEKWGGSLICEYTEKNEDYPESCSWVNNTGLYCHFSFTAQKKYFICY